MPKTRRQFSPQFKGEAVQIVVSLDRPTADVARDLRITVGTLANWANAWRKKNSDPATATEPVVKAAHVAEMRAENRRLRMKNHFLEKAAAFLAKRTTVAGDGPAVSPDLIERDFSAPEQDSASSATSPICARERWLYVATVLDPPVTV